MCAAPRAAIIGRAQATLTTDPRPSRTRTATHNRYFPDFAALIGSVEEALTYFAAHPERVQALFGRYLDEMAASGDAAPPAAA